METKKQTIEQKIQPIENFSIKSISLPALRLNLLTHSLGRVIVKVLCPCLIIFLFIIYYGSQYLLIRVPIEYILNREVYIHKGVKSFF